MEALSLFKIRKKMFCWLSLLDLQAAHAELLLSIFNQNVLMSQMRSSFKSALH